GVRRARVEPHVQDVTLLLEVGTAARRAARAGGQQLRRRALVPGVGALLLEDVGDVTGGLGAQERRLAAPAIERGDGHAPEPLARDAPVGPGRDHVADALLAPGRIPLD